MAPSFFLTYARSDDKDGLISMFFDDLCAELDQRGHKGGYMDRSLRPGQLWEEEIADAIHMSGCLVSMYSRRFFWRRWCGREYQVFLCPSKAYDVRGQAQGRLAVSRRIVPVIWTKSRIPRPVAAVQHDSEEYSRVYRDHGLRYLMQDPDRSGYERMVRCFAADVLRSEDDQPRSATDRNYLKNWRQIPPVFPNPLPGAVTLLAALIIGAVLLWASSGQKHEPVVIPPGPGLFDHLYANGDPQGFADSVQVCLEPGGECDSTSLYAGTPLVLGSGPTPEIEAKLRKLGGPKGEVWAQRAVFLFRSGLPSKAKTAKVTWSKRYIENERPAIIQSPVCSLDNPQNCYVKR